MKQKVFDMQKGIKEVTITIDFDDYIEIMASLKTINDGISKETSIKLTEDIISIIEEIEPKYIWDD